MATILAAAAHVEHTLAEELELRGLTSSGDSPSFAKAIELARAGNVFRDPEVLERLDTLRLVRNPLTHRKAEGHAHSIRTRFRAQKRHPQQILEEDARHALDLMHGLFFATMRSLDEEA